MKVITTLLIGFSLCAPALAKKPQPIQKNASRKAVDQFTGNIFRVVGDLTPKKPETKLPKPTFKLGKSWTPKWQISKDGQSMIVRFMPTDDKRLELGQANAFVTSQPFTTKLKQAPNVLDEAVAIEFEIQRWLPQPWKNYTIPALNRLKIRGFQDMQSGGADNEMHATEPFAIKTKSGKIYWVLVKAESGYHKTKGMTLQKALNALAFE